MRKELIAIGIVILALAIFFLPKDAGRTGGGFVMPGDTWTNKECSCFGIGYEREQITDAPKEYRCAGIPHSCTCTSNRALDVYGKIETTPTACE